MEQFDLSTGSPTLKWAIKASLLLMCLAGLIMFAFGDAKDVGWLAVTGVIFAFIGGLGAALVFVLGHTNGAYLDEIPEQDAWTHGRGRSDTRFDDFGDSGGGDGGGD